MSELQLQRIQLMACHAWVFAKAPCTAYDALMVRAAARLT